ncbi:arginase [Actibacterium ureilyticum]|uniref:arginase n=1 Tax=Actibacterium ureilyticum TaxID=1590614 RepID=UPI000BAB13AF|nr:arginase [Actibacterium ureilyticum]
MGQECVLIGAPVESGARQPGCRMGPDALRVSGLAQALCDLGLTVTDQGDVAPDPDTPDIPDTPPLYRLRETVAWTRALMPVAERAMAQGFPIFMGGDHALSLGTVAGVAAHAKDAGRPLFVLWLDAHSDFHTPLTTTSGNLHGTPLAYVTGQPGFDAFLKLPATVPAERICLLGLRSVDPAERQILQSLPVAAHDMRGIDEQGIAAPLKAFLQRVADEGGLLHVSFDVDFLEPDIAPAVGTTVPGGTTFREAHLVMELLHDSGLVTSLDLVELNPFLDVRGGTARLMVDLCASLFGRSVFDRPTRPA